MWLTLGVSLKTLQIQRFEKPLQNTDIHSGAPTFIVFGYVYKHYSFTSVKHCVKCKVQCKAHFTSVKHALHCALHFTFVHYK